MKRIFLALFVLALSSLPATAQLLEEATNSREVAMIFHKISNIKPDYGLWASYTQEYGTALAESKEEVLEEETLKMQLAYANLNVDYPKIVVRTSVKANVKQGRNAVLELDFEAPDPIYFPYHFAERDYAVIAENIDVLKNIPLGVLEASYIRNKLPLDKKVYLVMTAIPYKTDAKNPFVIEDTPFWLMLSKIATLEIYNRDLESLWSWKASWYTKAMISTENNTKLQ